MSRCKIHLDNYNGIYHAGDKIVGRVECIFDDETKVKGIKIKIKCQEYNKWTETEYESDLQSDDEDSEEDEIETTYSGSNFILNVEQVLLQSGKERIILSRGRHSYPFFYVLPLDIPSSYVGPYGSISYKLEATVHRSLIKTNYKNQITFQVVSPIDFNKMPKELQLPVHEKGEKRVCSLFCAGGRITMHVEIPKSAFVPGEILPMRVYVSNQSNRKVRELDVYLEKIVTYKVTDPSTEVKEQKAEILSHKDEGVGARGERNFNLLLQIPPNVVVHNFSNCKLFKVSYMMKVSCKMPKCTLDLKVKMLNIQLGDIQMKSQQVGSKDFEKVSSLYRPSKDFAKISSWYRPSPASVSVENPK